MGTLQIETVEDADSGMIRATLRGGAENALLIQSEPMYETHDAAEAEIVEVLKRAWPSSNPFQENPTIGV